MSNVLGRPPGSVIATLATQARFVQVIASTEFKLKYAGSALGYVWSLLKPLALFSVLYVVFGSFFKVGAGFSDYPLYLLIGIVMWTFFSDAVSVTMPSIVAHGSLLRKLSFPRLVIPLSATLTATLTFAINLIAIVALIGWERIVPAVHWLLLVPLVVELYLFTLGFALILATLFVRFRDVAQIWELLGQLLFFGTPIFYLVGFLPPWARSVSLLNPFTQVMQDVREIILYRAREEDVFTADTVLGSGGRLFPIAIAIATFAFGVVLFRREEPWFAERV